VFEQPELHDFSDDIMVHEEQVGLKTGPAPAYRVYCPRCRISILSVTSADYALASLKDHLRILHKLDAVLTRREVASII